MKFRSRLQSSLVAATLTALPACNLAYNGAWKLAPEDRMAVQAYYDHLKWRQPHQDDRHVRQATVPHGASHRSRHRSPHSSQRQVASVSPALIEKPLKVATRGRTGRIARPDTGGTHPSDQGGDAHDIRFAASPAAGSTIRLGLYGQLPSAQQDGDHSIEGADNLHRLTFTTEGEDFDPAIDPTGTLLVYASTQHRASADLYVKHINGSSVTQLTDDSAHDVMPVFSPDGKRIAFASDRSGNWDIYMMDVNGGQPVQLTDDPAHDLHPSFSPDGSKLVYSSHTTQSGQWELVVIEIDSPSTKRYIGHGLFPEWSPTDNRIVFQRPRERGTRWFSVWMIDLINGEGVRPTEIAASANAAAVTPTWSPDGKFIAFSTIVNPDTSQLETPPQADIWIMGADGSGRANLTRSQYANLQPVWSRDGSIVMVTNRGEQNIENIWSIRPDRAMRAIQPATTRPSDSSATLPSAHAEP